MVCKLVFTLLLAAGYCAARVPTRIIGGELTTIDHYTSLVQLESYLESSSVWTDGCAGSILNSRNILTSGNCQGNIARWRIRAGSSYLGVGGQTVEASQWILQGGADIAVLQLQNQLTYSAVVQQATIPPLGYEIPDNTAVVYAGWGTTSANSSEPSEQLRDVTVNTVNFDECREKYLALDPPLTVTENMICAESAGKDACTGDVGGPLYLSNVLVGVISWNYDCGNEDYPGVSTKVSAFTTWIQDVTV